jgi:hypothetical protein
METRRQGVPLATAVCCFIGTVVVIQLWLLAAALDAVLGGDLSVTVPAALASLGLLGLNVGLLGYLRAFDRDLRLMERRG